MTIRRIHQVLCDMNIARSCHHWRVADPRGAVSARALEQGWAELPDGKHACPACASRVGGQRCNF